MSGIRCTIQEKISRCDADEWDEIVRASGSGVLMSHEFVAAAEEAFEDQARFAARDRPRRWACRGLREFLCLPDRLQPPR